MGLFLRALTHPNASIEEGAAYRRASVGAFIETAYVVEVAPDKMGIPHVRFKLQVGRGTAKAGSEYRTLSLEAFSARYKDRVR